MCGIAGVARLHANAQPPSGEQLRVMCDTLVHRGPDDSGSDVTDEVGMCMRRLAIIDLAGGAQPFFNERRTVRAVYNGEIYNFRELRADLASRGHRFRSDSDGEVLVHLWEEYGEAFPEKLNGMFAIALYDAARHQLVLVRDRIGIKPLYWGATRDHLVFGSEVKALLASGLLPRDLNLAALSEFLAWEYVPSPRTLLNGVFKLEPGTLLIADLANGSIDQKTYWQLQPEKHHGTRSEKEWEELVDQKIRESVRRRLVSDVPLGALLSGGVDSSLVVANMGKGHAFSLGFDDPSYDELEWAKRVADALGVEHHFEVLEPQAAELFDSLMHFMDDPIADFSIFPTYLVSKLARKQVTVALSGDGGDELFGGYDTYLAHQTARIWQRLPHSLRRLVEPTIAGLKPTSEKKGLINKAKRFVEGVGYDAQLEHARWRLFAPAALRASLFTAEANESLSAAENEGSAEQHMRALLARGADRSGVNRQLYADLKSYLVDNCLVKVDRMSMACSLEVRVPLLDHELVELAFQIPDSLKIRRQQTKVLLKRVAARHIPRECAYRPKEGFSMPVKEWLRSELRPLMKELLDPQSLEQDGMFDSGAVTRLVNEHHEGRANHSHVLWAMMVFQDWKKRWLRQ